MSERVARFEDRVALVTGTGRANGIGWATAKILGQEGAFVAAGVRTERDIDEVNSRLAESDINGMAVEMNFTNLQGYELISQKSDDRLKYIENVAGRAVTDLVHVAGLTHDGPSLKLTEAEWIEIDRVKNMGPFFLTQAALRSLRKAKPGRVVGVSSVAGLYGHNGQANYSAANSGMLGWIRALAHEYNGKGINFNGFAPGVVDTDMTRGTLTPQQYDALLEMVPSGEAFQPEEIAEGIVDLLASDKTGHVEVMDGGVSEKLKFPE